MKRIILLYSIVMCVSALGFGQESVPSQMPFQTSRKLGYMALDVEKPIIDTAAINQWPSLGQAVAISNDGNYCMYTIENLPMGSKSLVVQSTSGTWKQTFPGAIKGIFSGDSKTFVFMQKDTLLFLLLSEDGPTKISKVANVSGYSEPKGGKGSWLAYKMGNSEKILVLRNLITGKEQHFGGVDGYLLSEKGNTILLRKSMRVGNAVITNLEWVNTLTGRQIVIWSSSDFLDKEVSFKAYRIDNEGVQASFIVQERLGEYQEKVLWYYREGMGHAVEKVNNESLGMVNGLNLSEASFNFSQDGRYIFFNLEGLQPPKADSNAVSVDIWSYKDTLLQSAQLQYCQDREKYVAVIAIGNDRVVRLTQVNEVVDAYSSNGDFVVVKYDRMNWREGDMYWLRDSGIQYWLVSLFDGSRKLLKTQPNSTRMFWFSPGGRFLLYYESKNKDNYFSYDLQTGKIVNLTYNIPVNVLGGINEYVPKYYSRGPFGSGVAFWLAKDQGVLVYGKYDLWQLDLSGRQAPVNLTHGYGQAHHVVFRVAGLKPSSVYDSGTQLLLVAYNKENKMNGFYRLIPGQQKNPEILTMGPWTFCHEGFSYEGEIDQGMLPLKAGNIDSWLVKRQSASESPNYFFTRDFKTYKPLSDIYPERRYNWVKAELVSWKQLDGTMTQGILYRPENFDFRKKYPVLITYYMQMTTRLHEYPLPEFAHSADLNIPWFVSRGYLMLLPDIYFTSGVIGKSAMNTIMSAGKYLASLPYVDGKRMAISGHSFAGHQTYYLLTHCKMFAAGVSGAGCTDAISESLSLTKEIGNNSWMRNMEVERMGGKNLWQDPKRYVDESAVFWADRLTTPLLIFQNEKDFHWRSGVEFFTALRRFGKKVWMLQYDGEGHVLWEKRNQIDLSIRLTQFFDYYLKGTPPPIWMTEGIPARRKGIKTGYTLDHSGKRP